MLSNKAGLKQTQTSFKEKVSSKFHTKFNGITACTTENLLRLFDEVTNRSKQRKYLHFIYICVP